MGTDIELIETSGKHFYKTPIGILPSVTTIISIVRNPAVEAWKEREPKWREISDYALSIGTRVHKVIECYFKDRHEELRSLYGEDIRKPFRAFLEWKVRTRFEVVDAEIGVWSEHRYAGTLDFSGYLDGKLYIIDIKTSKRIYSDYIMQISAYRQAYEERSGNKVHGIGILRLDKYSRVSEWKEYSEEEYQKALQEFLFLCDCWHLSKDGEE